MPWLSAGEPGLELPDVTLCSHDTAHSGRPQGLLVLAGVGEQFSRAQSGAVLLRTKEADWLASGYQAQGFQ